MGKCKQFEPIGMEDKGLGECKQFDLLGMEDVEYDMEGSDNRRAF